MTPAPRENQDTDDLIAELGVKDGVARQRAREELVAMGKSVTPQLLPLLEHRSETVRWEAAKILVSLADARSVPALVESIRDEDQDVRWLAAEALAAIGRPSLAPLLEAMVEEKEANLYLREGVHRVLHELRDTELGEIVTPVYDAVSRSASVDAVVAAKHALEKLR
ncbi:MAG: HEAT repeat domain-containing protein [Candidatus Krumholzibacteriia bacterium]|nr:HEAT repeat domain-containing protein [bacterium]